MAKSLLPRTRTVCPYSNSSRRDFTAEAQREKRTSRKTERRLNTKAPRHKGQREREETFSHKERRGIKRQTPDFSFI